MNGSRYVKYIWSQESLHNECVSNKIKIDIKAYVI